MTGIDIRCLGMDGGTALHAIRTESGEWHWSGPGWSGVVRGQQQHVVTALADAIGRGEIYRIDVMPGDMLLAVDRLGGTWHDGAYWSPFDYLPEITGDYPETREPR